MKSNLNFNLPTGFPRGGDAIKRGFRLGTLLAGPLLLAGCNFEPHYEKPSLEAPAAFKELTPAQAKETDGWKTAEPQDSALRGRWWEMFQQPELNALEEQVTVTNNQTLAAAFQSYLVEQDLMKEARTGYFPTVSADPSAARFPGPTCNCRAVWARAPGRR